MDKEMLKKIEKIKKRLWDTTLPTFRTPANESYNKALTQMTEEIERLLKKEQKKAGEQ